MSQAGEVTDFTDIGVEFLLLCDGAQVVGGKLYVLGGAWDRLQFPSYPQTYPMGLAFGVRVPWTESNRAHTFAIRGVNADGDAELFKAEGQFEVGRPPGTPRGMSQLFQVALQVPLPVPAPGSYAIEAVLDDGKARRVTPYFAVQVP